MSFQNKNILIIGASSGIGFSLAESLIQLGANVFTASRTQANLPAKYAFWDAKSPENEAFSELPTTLDGLVYCPGTINLKPANRLSMADFQNDLQI